MKSCLIISYGPVPTPKYQKIEGGGMRCWGLAKGLATRGYDVTVAVNQSFPLDVTVQNDIHLINWQEDAVFGETLNAYDAVIINYSMGGPMSFVVDHISDHVTLILDCYVPIYVEVSARDANDMPTEYANYSIDITHWNKALRRGDYFLCANEPQKHMYMGALGALGILNPYSYKTQRVHIVPFGVEESLDIAHPHNPYVKLGIQKDDFVLLWFGGLYPWFNIKPLLYAVSKLTDKYPRFKFVIVGGKNPYNQNPDFQKQYDETHEYITKQGILNKSVYFVDWVDYSERINWYQHANVVISINNDGDENIYSWRTRVMDFVWGEVPMLTNGGDPLSDSLIAAGAAILLPDTEENTIYKQLSAFLADTSNTINSAKKKLKKEKRRYYWQNVVAPIDRIISESHHPYLAEKVFKIDNGLDMRALEPPVKKSLAKKMINAPRKIAGVVKRKGVKRSVALALTTISNRAHKAIVARTSKQYYFFSHPVDYTGAPLVLLDVINDFLKHIKPQDVSLVYPGGEPPLINRIRKLGIKMDKTVLGVGSRVIHAQLGVKKDDFVLLNTVAIYPNYRDYIFGLLDSGRLNEAVWFIHEDKPELRFQDDKGLVARVKRLINDDKLKVFVPSQQTAKEYNEFFQTDKVRPITLRVDVPAELKGARAASDFKTIRFMLSGTSTDGRKGQLLTVSALAHFMRKYYDKAPEKYRDFHLTLIAVGKDDYISAQIRSISKTLLGKRVTIHTTVPKDEAMRLTDACNVTVCSSLNETFGLFVAEGMLMGHIILRNKSSGYHEQMRNGKNGYIVDTLDIDKFADAIERTLNKEKVSGTALSSMSKASVEIARKFQDSDYHAQLMLE